MIISAENGALHKYAGKMAKVCLVSFQRLLEILSLFLARIHLATFS